MNEEKLQDWERYQNNLGCTHGELHVINARVHALIAEVRRLIVERDNALNDQGAIREAVKIARQRADRLGAENERLRKENDSRQRSIELLGKAIGTAIPNFRTNGTGEEHSAKCAEALIVENKRLRENPVYESWWCEACGSQQPGEITDPHGGESVDVMCPHRHIVATVRLAL